MDDTGVITMPHQRPGDGLYIRTEYLLTHPWYRATLPRRIDVQAGREGLAHVLWLTQKTLLERDASPQVVQAVVTLVRNTFDKDPWVSAVRLCNPKKASEHPFITGIYNHEYPRYNEAELADSHQRMYELLTAFILSLSTVSA